MASVYSYIILNYQILHKIYMGILDDCTISDKPEFEPSEQLEDFSLKYCILLYLWWNVDEHIGFS